MDAGVIYSSKDDPWLWKGVADAEIDEYCEEDDHDRVDEDEYEGDEGNGDFLGLNFMIREWNSLDLELFLLVLLLLVLLE